MAANENWQRWVYASISKHLHTLATAGGVSLVVEFLDTRSASWKAATTRAEATITGPVTREVRSGSYLVTANVFVVVTSDRRPTGDGPHLDQVGVMQNALDRCIDVKDYGTSGLVDVGVLAPVGEITPTHIKPRDTDDQIFSTISADYEGSFTE